MLVYEKLIELFLKNFPEFIGAFEEHYEEYEEVLNHVFFGDNVNLTILELLNDDKKNEEKLNEIFNFLEKMAVEGDSRVKDLLSVTILARLGDDRNLLEKSYKFMGRNTRKASAEIEEYWGRC